MLVFINGNVASVLESPSSQDKRKIGRLMGTGIAEIGAKDDGSAIQQ